MNQCTDLKSRELKIESAIYIKHQSLCQTTDKLFAYLLFAEWIIGILFALIISPKTWTGEFSQTNIHVYAAIFLGGFTIAVPIYFIHINPGTTLNRSLVAMSQMLISILLIHLTGGRIETHFHIFGSLAFLAFYRDLRPLLIGTAVTALDHLFRGFFWPQSVYGILNATPWRALEHTAWVTFEDVILICSIINAKAEMRTIATSEVDNRELLYNIEREVHARTIELEQTQKIVLEQQQKILNSAKMASLGRMAAGIAHEINNPVAIVSGAANLLDRLKDQPEKFHAKIDAINRACERVTKIVLGLKKFARPENLAPVAPHPILSIIGEAVKFNEAKALRNRVTIIDETKINASVVCSELDIEQAIINVLDNAIWAASMQEERWVKLELLESDHCLILRITDSGNGSVLESIKDKLYDPFFSTKPVGEGTGLGLSVTKGILERNNAEIECITHTNTRFEIRFRSYERITNEN